MSPPASTLTRRPAVRARGQRLAQAAEALKPLKAELLRRAHAAAAERVEQAATEDAANLARAEREAALILEQARQEGVAEASRWLASQRARSQRKARAVILRVRAETLEELRGQSLAAVARLATLPDYPRLRNRLVDYVRAQLGEEAVITEAATGGVVGTVPGRQLDCSFATLVQQELAERAAQPNMPWTT
jgi:hypothetical protein